MLTEKQKNLFRIKKVFKFLLRPEKLSISDRLLNYIFDNLISVIITTVTAFSFLISLVVIFLYYLSLKTQLGIQFNVESSFYIFTNFVITSSVLFFFFGFILLCFYPGCLGAELFKDMEEKFPQSKDGFTEAKIKIIYYFYFPLILLSTLLFLFFLLKIPLAVVSPLLLLIFPGGVFIYIHVSLKKLGFKESKIIVFCMYFWMSWYIFITIVWMISLFSSHGVSYCSVFEKYSTIILTIVTIFIYNMVVSFNFYKIDYIKRFFLLVLFGIIMLYVIDMNFNEHNKILQGIVKVAGIKKDKVKILVTQEACNILKIKSPVIIAKEQYGLCETLPINILFNLGKNCIIDPLQKNIEPFSIPCEDIKS